MKVIPVPRPPKSARNPERPVNALLQMQIQHLHDAERNLPLRYRTTIYTRAIKTEGEAARYIREVTEAIHQAHADAAAQAIRPARRRKGVAIAAAAARTARKRSAKGRKQTSAARPRRKKK